jgi:hypothetical protein
LSLLNESFVGDPDDHTHWDQGDQQKGQDKLFGQRYGDLTVSCHFSAGSRRGGFRSLFVGFSK